MIFFKFKCKDKLFDKRKSYYEDWRHTYEFNINVKCLLNSESIDVVLNSNSTHHLIRYKCPFCDDEFELSQVEFAYSSDSKCILKNDKDTHFINSNIEIKYLLDKVYTSFWEYL